MLMCSDIIRFERVAPFAPYGVTWWCHKNAKTSLAFESFATDLGGFNLIDTRPDIDKAASQPNLS